MPDRRSSGETEIPLLPSTPMRRACVRIGAVLFFGVLALGIFARLMNYELRRDEELYVPPAVLLDQYRLYVDFFYNHVPGSAWFFHASNALFGAGGLLFSARFGVFFFWVLFAAAIAFFSWRITKSHAATFFLLILALTNEQLLSVVGVTATNNFLPLPFAYIGLALFVLGVRGQGLVRKIPGLTKRMPDPAMIFGAGAFLAAALAMKASAIAFIAPVVIAALLLPAGIAYIDRVKRTLVPLAAGGAIAASPVIVEFLRAPELFLAHVVRYHTGPHIAYWAGNASGDEDVAMALGAKGLLAHEIWLTGANLLLVLAAATISALLIATATSRKSRGRIDGALLLAFATFAVVAVFGFAPTPSFPQYFAPPIAVLLLLIALLYEKLGSGARRGVDVALVTAAVIGLAIGSPRIVQHLPRLAEPQVWTVAKTHRAGGLIAEAMAKAGVQGRVATLMPVYALEGGLEVYPEFATGQFVYRTSDFMGPDLLKYYKTTSPETVEALFRKDPPAALLLGFETALEAPMRRFALENGYRRIAGFTLKDRYGEGELWLEPAN